jgi:DNA polymerase III subunit alpha
MGAVALTDWGNLYGTLYLKKTTDGSNVKPIYGAELGVVVDSNSAVLRHTVLLAQNNKGFENLKFLVSEAHTKHGYDEKEGLRPQVPLDEVIKHSEGLIMLTGGIKGLINSYLLQDQRQKARELVGFLKKNLSPGSLFLELQASSLSVQEQCNETLIGWAREEGLPLVATTDAHYLKPDDALAQEVWMMVGQKLSEDQNPRSSLVCSDFCIKTPEEMRETFSHVIEACDNTQDIAERCNVTFKFKDGSGKRIYHLPSFTAKGMTEAELFSKECFEGLEVRLKEVEGLTSELRKTYEERLDYEIGVIQNMGFAGYYLIVSDFIRWAKRNDIPVGPGRGSGAGSLAAWVLDIIDLDPIKYGLLFERFLNPERVSLPDFDVDFCQARRHEVIKYVAEKYGRDQVTQIVTFAKEQSKNALKDVGRVYGLTFGETNRLTKLVPVVQARPYSIQETLDEVAEFSEIYEQDGRIKQVVDIGMKIEGALRQAGVHAAGVIIASRPVYEIAPVSRDVNGNLITQWDMKMSEEAGLVKFDFLGLVTLDLLDLACKLINQRPEPEAQTLNYQNIPIDDPRAYEMISRGDTLGMFQLESGGMQNLCVRLKPDKFEEVTAINALFRPGPLETGMVDDFINRKFGRSKIEVMFEEMAPVLDETYGIIVYQEQVQNLARVVAGYTLGGADLLRRAMGKKIPEEMEAQRKVFVDGAVANGKPPEKASELFDLIAKFAGYGFNKSHAAAYAKLAVQTAFLKAVYPTEFFTALLTIEKENTDKLSRYIQDAKLRKIKILSPDVNQSDTNFTSLEEGVIRFGLSAIKNVGESSVDQFISIRKKDGPFKDIFDFLKRTQTCGVNKRQAEALIMAGAFDSFAAEGQSAAELRGSYLATLEKAIDWAAKENRDEASGQFSLFGDSAGGTSQMMKPQVDKGKAPTKLEMLGWEKQYLGVFITGSPLDGFEEKRAQAGAISIFDLAEKAPRSKICVAAIVSEFREVRIKRGRRVGEMMGILKLEDESGQVEMVSFPDHFKEFAAHFRSGRPLLVRADLDFEEDKAKLIGGDATQEGRLSVEYLEEFEEKWPRLVRLKVDIDRVTQHFGADRLYVEISRILKAHSGPVPVQMQLFKGGYFETSLELGDGFKVHPHAELLRELNSIVSIPGCVAIDKVL